MNEETLKVRSDKRKPKEEKDERKKREDEEEDVSKISSSCH